MCQTCWKEFGSPTNKSPDIFCAVRLMEIIYDDNEVGMPLHTALDDWGIEGVWERWPDHQKIVSPGAWEAAGALCMLMNRLSVEDRASALALFSGYCK